MYIQMMGGADLRRASETAILSANYIASELENHFPVLYKGVRGRVAHECILDLREIQKNTGITVEDVAKRLMDFGFHAPTMAWPVVGTLMIEPTESEDKEEMDRFIQAMVLIRTEIEEIEQQKTKVEESPLRNAPHTFEGLMLEKWDRNYSKDQAYFPAGKPDAATGQSVPKFWPTVNRVDHAHGDRNLICACPPMDDYL
jgi:glycine dehydrogenase